MTPSSRHAALLLLSLALLCSAIPGAQAHCPSNTTCMKHGWINETAYQASVTVSGSPLVQGAQCADACAEAGFKYFSLRQGKCSCDSTCTTERMIHGDGFTGVTFACYEAPSGFLGTSACTAPRGKRCGTFACPNQAKCSRSGMRSKCCCDANNPNAVFSGGKFRGCASQ